MKHAAERRAAAAAQSAHGLATLERLQSVARAQSPVAVRPNPPSHHHTHPVLAPLHVRHTAEPSGDGASPAAVPVIPSGPPSPASVSSSTSRSSYFSALTGRQPTPRAHEEAAAATDMLSADAPPRTYATILGRARSRSGSATPSAKPMATVPLSLLLVDKHRLSVIFQRISTLVKGGVISDEQGCVLKTRVQTGKSADLESVESALDELYSLMEVDKERRAVSPVTVHASSAASTGSPSVPKATQSYLHLLRGYYTVSGLTSDVRVFVLWH